MAQITIKDTATAALARLGAKIKNRAPVMEAAGLAVVSLTVRAFNDPAVRASPWAALKPATIEAKLRAGASTAILKNSTLLFRSWRVVDFSSHHVRVGSDRFYARFHQFGSRDGRLPARPMLPLEGSPDSPRFADFAVRSITSAAREALRRLLG